MGTLPVNRLLVSMSIPMMISMIIQALYNVVDSIFVSQISEAALTAVSMAFPIQNLMIAVAAGTGVGVNALLSRSLGEKNQAAADKTANVSWFLAILSCLAFVVFGIFGTEFFMRAQTDIPEIVEAGTVYIQICTICSFGIFGQITAEKLLQSTGRTIYSMITQGLGAVTNIILDPILIFGYFGMPKMGVAGAAVATVAGQIFGMALGIVFNICCNKDIHLDIREIRPDRVYITRIYEVGIPSILMQSIGSVMTFCMNKILIGFTETATAVFGIYFKIQSFFFMPVFGLNNGMVPIVAYNYGARKKRRILQTFRLSAIYATGIMLIGLAVFQTIPGSLLKLFHASDFMLEIGVPALRIVSISYLFAGFCIVSSSMFQALGNSIYSLIVSVARQLLVLVPAAYFLSLTGELQLVWLAYPIAEIMSVSVCIFFLRKIIRNKLSFQEQTWNS
ncbi:MAG: MATE family efflux transporter [Clostridiales bacterium]|nr:MATE family efflux transporter [Clostridiales bacterium]